MDCNHCGNALNSDIHIARGWPTKVADFTLGCFPNNVRATTFECERSSTSCAARWSYIECYRCSCASVSTSCTLGCYFIEFACAISESSTRLVADNDPISNVVIGKQIMDILHNFQYYIGDIYHPKEYFLISNI
ncbi:hypothetical protein ANCCAN_09647 [Ancylostoma caninum]|uniref:Uncharacterized protein n=1 Tax=Ancylostoma caninum TaxID=29170 RepID=A0A368GMT2_ANCCA|nr:hypothetical protein ANCCAN_09647 [Ancylostoma caninum]